MTGPAVATHGAPRLGMARGLPGTCANSPQGWEALVPIDGAVLRYSGSLNQLYVSSKSWGASRMISIWVAVMGQMQQVESDEDAQRSTGRDEQCPRGWPVSLLRTSICLVQPLVKSLINCLIERG